MNARTLTALCLMTMLSLLCACGDDDPVTPADETPTAAPRTGLVAEYLFSGNADDSAGSNHGTASGGLVYIADRFGTATRACAFDGDNDAVTTPQDRFVNGNNVSMSLWFRMPATTGALRYFVLCSDICAAINGGEAQMVISLPATNNAGATYATANTWHHLLGTYDGTNIRCYLDGVLAETTLHAGDIADPDYPLTFGAFDTEFWHGDLDDVRIYNRTISDAGEISALLHEGGFGE